MSFNTGRFGYVVRRLLQAVPVILAILALNFLLLHLAPGDAAQVLAIYQAGLDGGEASFETRAPTWEAFALPWVGSRSTWWRRAVVHARVQAHSAWAT